MNRVKQFARSRLLTKDQSLQTNYYLELIHLLNEIILDTSLASLHIKGDQSEQFFGGELRKYRSFSFCEVFPIVRVLKIPSGIHLKQHVPITYER